MSGIRNEVTPKKPGWYWYLGEELEPIKVTRHTGQLWCEMVGMECEVPIELMECDWVGKVEIPSLALYCQGDVNETTTFTPEQIYGPRIGR